MVYTIAHLNNVIRKKTGCLEKLELRPNLDDVPPQRKGASNYVVPVPEDAPKIAVRVSIRGTSADSLDQEIECARATGVAMVSIWSGLVRFKRGDVRAVSCWPWATPLAEYVRKIKKPGERRMFTLKVERKLLALSDACIYVDVKAENMMVYDGEPVLIDFDPFLTKRVDELDARCRAAARGFVPVAMLLISCSMESHGLAFFETRDIERATSGPNEGLVDRLAAACDRVFECFPDLGCALMSVMQRYIPFWVSRGSRGSLGSRGSRGSGERDPCDHYDESKLVRVSRMAGDWEALDRIASHGLYGAHVRAFLGLALRGECEAFWAAFGELNRVGRYEGGVAPVAPVAPVAAVAPVEAHDGDALMKDLC